MSTRLRGVAHAVAACVLISALAAAPGGQATRSEELAQRQFQSGLSFVSDGKYDEALKDFQAVVDGYPESSVADDALLEIARYQLEQRLDAAAAQQAVDLLLKKYPTGDAAPMAYALAGRILLAGGQAPADLDTALASFERVPRLFPGTEAVAAAHHHAGEALRRAGRHEEALDRYIQATLEYPGSSWSARALLGSAFSLVHAGRPLQAVDAVQRVRNRFPGSPEAERALAFSTILYRLYVRAPGQPPYVVATRTISGSGGKLKDVLAMGFDGRQRLVVVNKNAGMVFEGDGSVARSLPGASPKGLFFDRGGRPVIALKGIIQPEGSQPLPLVAARPDGQPRQLDDIPGGGALSPGEYLVVDKAAKTVARFTTDGKYAGVFATVDAARLTTGPLDEVAVIDRNAKSVVVFQPDGRPQGRLPAKGAGYEFSSPVDLAFDPLGHLYVLDPGRGSVFVFAAGPKPRLVATFTIADKSPGAFRRASAFAIDAVGRLFIHDERAELVQVYR
jgi:TolA-binding protein